MKKRENINNKINKKKKIRPVMIVLFAFSIYFVYTFIEQQVQINKGTGTIRTCTFILFLLKLLLQWIL